MNTDVSSSSPVLNPFAPPADSTAPLIIQHNLREITPDLCVVRALMWTLVCVVSAGPSFAFGWSTIATHQFAAMCVGILIFIVAYTMLDLATWNHAWRNQRRTRLTLRIGYISRMVISVVFPVGAFVDVFCGVISIQVVGMASGGVIAIEENASFGTVLAVTLVQGLVLNVVLAAFMALVHALLLISTSK